MSNETSRVLTLVFTDLADSTALKSARGDVAVGDLISRHRDHVTRLAEECAGRIINWAGDGCFLTFETASAGVMFTLRLQQAHADASELPGVRIGIHMGEVTEKPSPEGDDEHPRIEGLAVDIAARISGLAKPGQVLMSSAVYNSAKQRMGVEAMGMPLLWQLHGTYALKGFDQHLDIAEAGIKGFATLEAPLVGDKARLVRKAKKQPEKFEQHRMRGVPLWAVFVIVLVLVIVIGVLLLREPGPSQSTPGDTPITSIAVLPFENYSGDETQEYFVNGMTDTLTAELAKIKAIKVMARTSAMRYKGTDKTPDEIARELGVEGLIEGSIQRTENAVKITAQLIDGQTNEHVWAGNFDGTVENILRLQGEVAIAIAEELGAVLAPEERAEFERNDNVNPAAWELYLQARETFRLRTEENFERAIDLLKGAIAADPEFADAHALLGLVHAARPLNLEAYLLEDDFALAHSHAERALELDPDSVEARFALAWVAMPGNWDWDEFNRHVQSALELDPDNGYVHFLHFYYLFLTGQYAAAREAIERAVDLDSMHTVFHSNQGTFFQAVERYDEALAANRKAGELSPEHVNPPRNIARILAQRGDSERALAAFSNLGEGDVDDDVPAQVYAHLGMTEEANAALLAGANRGEFSETGGSMEALARLGREDEALDHFQKVMDRNSLDALVLMLTLGPHNPLWENPRTWELYESYGVPHFPPEHPAHEYQQAWLRQNAAAEVLAAQPKPEQRFRIEVPEGTLLLGIGVGSYSADLSRDGQSIVYTGNAGGISDNENALFIRRLGELTSRRLPGTEDARTPTISPDGREVAFATTSAVKKISLAGGEATVLGPGHPNSKPRWLEDGSIVVARTGSEAVLIPSDGGPEKVIHTTQQRADILFPTLTPDGKTMLISPQRIVDDSLRYSVVAVDLETGIPRTLIESGSHPQYSNTGHLVFHEGGQLMAVPVDHETLEPLTDPVVIEADLATDSGKRVTYRVSNEGSLLYLRGDADTAARDRIVWLNEDGSEEPVDIPAGWFASPRVSPDGTHLAAGYSAQSELAMDIWVFDMVRGGATRLTDASTMDTNPHWTPDGRHVFFSSGIMDRNASIFRTRADGTGSIESFAVGGTQRPLISSLDERRSEFFFTVRNRETSADIVAWSVDGGDPRPVLRTQHGEYDAELSGDGNWLAYTSDSSGRPEVYLSPYPGMDRRWTISIGGGRRPLWSLDDSRLYYLSGNSLHAVSIQTDPEFSAGRPVLLFEKPFVSFWGRGMDISPRDGRILALLRESEENPHELVLVRNWDSKLKRLAPHPEAN